VVEDATKVVVGDPTQLGASPGVVIDTVDAGKHLPSPSGVLSSLVVKEAANYGWGIADQLGSILPGERGSCADDVLGKPQNGGAVFSEQMSTDDVFDIDAPVEVLVGFDVFIGERGCDLGVVIHFGEKSRCTQDHYGQALVPRNQLTQVLGRCLCHAIDVPRNGSNVLGDPRGG
jgi:hypothetical protein